MALIKCKECKAEISNKAKTCPQCGAPNNRTKTSPIAWAILAIMVTIIVVGLMNVEPDKPIVDSASNTKTDDPVKPDTDTIIKSNHIELMITLHDLNKGMVKFFKTIPQCSNATLTEPRLFKDGKNSYQEIILNSSKIDVITDIAESGKLTNIKFTSMGKIKNDSDLRAMMCSAYSVMRTLQPKDITQEDALKQAKHLWISSKDKPYETSYFSDKIKAQHIPFEFNVYRTE